MPRYSPYKIPIKTKRDFYFEANRFFVWCENKNVTIKFKDSGCELPVSSIYKDSYIMNKFYKQCKHNVYEFVKFIPKQGIQFKNGKYDITYEYVLDWYRNPNHLFYTIATIKPFFCEFQEVIEISYKDSELLNALGKPYKNSSYYLSIDDIKIQIVKINTKWNILFDIQMDIDKEKIVDNVCEFIESEQQTNNEIFLINESLFSLKL